MDVSGRAGRLRARLAAEPAGGDALLVTKLANVRYLTGFSGSAAVLLVLPDHPGPSGRRSGELCLVTDGRYRDQAAEELAAAGVEARLEIGAAARQREVLTAAVAGIGRLGLEATSVTWAQQRAFAADWFPAAELVPTEGVVEGLRRVKDDGELARMARAAAIADDALAAVVPLLLDRPTERELALALDAELRRRGATGNSFPTIVAGGPNGAKPHARPGERPIEAHELVVVDYGCVVDGYCSDTTRTFSVGEPAGEARRMVEVVAASQRAGVAAVRAGVAARAVDAACRQVIADAGWADAFVHGTGHGVGLEIHEAPSVAATSDDVLEAGHVVTVEPGVYLPGQGGVRIEDTVVVTAGGCRALTGAPKDLVVTG
jgi:Xaa-Pro aminopeptidase